MELPSIFKRKKVQSVTDVRPSREMVGIGEREEVKIEHVPLAERAGVVGARIEENIRLLLNERRVHAESFDQRLTAAERLNARELTGDPMAIEARIEIWAVLAQEHAVIAQKIAEILAEEAALYQARREIFAQKETHEAKETQVRNLDQERELKIAFLDEGLAEPDLLYGRIDEEPYFEEETAAARDFLAKSSKTRAKITAMLARNDLDLARNKEAQQLASAELRHFVRHRFNPDLTKCNQLRQQATEEVQRLLREHLSFWSGTQQLADTTPELESVEKARKRQDKLDEQRRRIGARAASTDEGLFGGLISRGRTDIESEEDDQVVLEPSAISVRVITSQER